MTTPFNWLSVVTTPQSSDAAIYAYISGLQTAVKASLQRATVAYNTLKTVRSKLGLEFITSSGGEGSADVGGWAPDLETQAQDLHAMAVFLDQIASDVKSGKRDLVWNKAFGAFAITALPGDVIRIELAQSGVPVIVDAKTGQPIHVDAPLGVGAVNWAELAVVAAIPTVGIYLTTTKFIDGMTVMTEQKTQRTLLEAAKKNTDLVAQGKATPDQAKALNDALYAGATSLQKEQNAPKLAGEKTSQDWSESLTMLAWAGVVVAGIVTLGKLIPSKSLLENPKPRVRSGYAYSTGRAAGLRGKDWMYAKDDDWEHVVVDEAYGQYRHVGTRVIDGTKMNVWYEASKQRYVAQTAHGGS